MAQPTAYRHQSNVHLNRADGNLIVLTMEEARVIAALVSPAIDARSAADRHLIAHRGLRHPDAE